MSRTSPPFLLAAFLLFTLFLFPSSQLHADWVETFEGSLDQTWVFGGDQGGSNNDFSQTIENGNLVLSADTLAGEAGAVFGTVVTEQFLDVVVTGVVSSDSENFYGLGLRSDGAGNTYLFVLNPVNENAEIVQVKNGAVSEQGTSNVITSFDSYDEFFLVFTAEGDTLIGEVYDEEGGTLLASTTYVDPDPLGAGFSGVLASFNQDPGSTFENINASFDSVTSTAIVAAVPEPTAFAMFGLIFASLLCWQRRLRAALAV